ncbi:MAG TPA: hypothetical protein V6D43_14085, partial [Candidatus Sericytochromatia bacterium]
HERSHFIVSENSQKRQHVSIPAEWGLPKFSLSTKIKTTTVIWNTTHIQTGEIVGIEYLKPNSYRVKQQGLKPGWSYTVEIDPDDLYQDEQTLNIYESEISKLKPPA